MNNPTLHTKILQCFSDGLVESEADIELFNIEEVVTEIVALLQQELAHYNALVSERVIDIKPPSGSDETCCNLVFRAQFRELEKLATEYGISKDKESNDEN